MSGYDLYRNGASVGTTSATSRTFSSLACGTSYTLGVDAFDAVGNKSSASTISASTAACPDTQAPTAPTSLTVTGSTTTSLSISWGASFDNVSVTGYDVYKGSTVAGTTSTFTSYTVSGLACGTSYTLAVDAFDAAGNKSTKTSLTTSTAACADTQAPTTPTGLTVTGSTTSSVSISWSASFDNVSVAGYEVYNGSTVAGTTSTFTSYTVSGLTCGTSYTLAVDAFDPSGNKSGEDLATTSTAACPTGPPPPATTCTSTISSGLQSAISGASAGAVICLNSGSYGSLTLSSLSKSSDVTIEPAAGAAVTIGTLAFNSVNHLHFTGAAGAMSIGGGQVDRSDVRSICSNHLTFDHITFTAETDVLPRCTNSAILFDSSAFYRPQHRSMGGNAHGSVSEPGPVFAGRGDDQQQQLHRWRQRGRHPGARRRERGPDRPRQRVQRH